MSNRKQCLNALQAFRKELGLRGFSEDENRFSFMVTGDNGHWPITCVVLGTGVLHVFSTLPLVIPPTLRAQGLEYVTRANCSIVFGCLDMNPDTGMVHFRTNVPVEILTEISSATFMRLVLINLMLTDVFLGNMRRIVSGELTPREAINRLRGRLDREDDEAHLEELLEDVDLDGKFDGETSD